MRALTESDVRASFINATDDELRMIEMPHDFLLVDWDFHDFLAWRDPASSKRGCIVIDAGDGPVGIVLRASDPGRSRSGMCNICQTMQPGNQVALYSARKAGPAGHRGDSVGTYICADLSCHENVRLAHPLAPNEVRAAGQVDMRLDGTRRRMERFVARVQEDTD
ncbi:FBP domain-containing protein [Microbacterium paludicola]|uniref:FBP domain-containing protein n=1 Tax=Microbacterium paludicola TaxID=300019 RepID=UPI00119F2595|nr:FBP domain-containing protein [Microbacterium paludicola]